jgi:hypothetical protein
MTDQHSDPWDPTTVTPTPATPVPDAPPQDEFVPAEPASRAAPVTAVDAPAGPSRRRWGVALGAIAVVVAISAAAVYALTGAAPPATVLGYVPAGSVMYGEFRMDLPGGQDRKVAEFLSHFPGFADQSSIQTKVNETLDQLVGKASSDKQTFGKDIQPWFEGELAFSVGELPGPQAVTSASGASNTRALLLLSVKNAALAQDWFDQLLTEGGAAVTTTQYGGTTITTPAKQGTPETGMAIIDGKVAVIGDLASVKSAIDTNGNGAFADEPGPKAAFAAADGSHLGLVYLALGKLYDWSASLQSSLQNALPSADPGLVIAGCDPSTMTKMTAGLLPEWATFTVKADSDALEFESVSPPPAKAVGPTSDRTSDLVKHIPASAIALAVTHDYGATLQQGIDLYKSQPCFKDAFAQLEKSADLAGGLDAILGWIGDTAIVVNGTDPLPEAGIVVKATDGADAAKLLTSLKGLISLGGAQQGISVREEDHNGTTIVVVSAGSIDKLAGSAMGTTSPVTLPSGNVELAWAVKDDLVVIGSGPGFVQHVLDTTDGTSLASDSRYKDLAGRVGDGTGITFVDLTEIRERVEGLISSHDPSALKAYETEVKPFLVPFDAFVASGSVAGDLDHSDAIITVK